MKTNEKQIKRQIKVLKNGVVEAKVWNLQNNRIKKGYGLSVPEATMSGYLKTLK